MPTGGIRTRTSGIMVPAFVASTTSVSFTGPLDLTSQTAAGAWGLRALKSSIAGSATAICRIYKSASTASQQDIGTTSSGALDTASITTFLGGSSGQYLQFYDQSGNGVTMPADPACVHLSDYDPALIAALSSQNAAGEYITTASVTLQQPCSVSAVARSDNTVGVNCFTGTDATNNPRLAIRSVSSYWFITVTGGEVPRLSSDSYVGAWQAIQGLYSSASSVLLVNGSCNTADCGAGDLTGHIGFLWTPSFSNFGTGGAGYGRELIWWNANTASSARDAIESNQRTFWGF